jgi:Protein of unknown function (DUF4239)
MNLLVALAIVIAAAALAALLMAAVRRRLTGPVLSEPARGTPTLTLVGTAFAVLLAFITLAAFQTYNGAKSGAASEATSVLEMFRTAEFFPANQRDELRSDLACYGRAVVSAEWPAMADGRSVPLVDHWITEYRRLFTQLDVRSPRDQEGFQEVLQEARGRTDGRQERLEQASPSVPTPLWLVLVLGGIVAIVLQLAMADRRERLAVQCGMIAGVAAIVAAGLLLVWFLDHPYEGHTGSIQPTDMQRTLTMMRAAEPTLHVPCTAEGTPSGLS